MWAGGSLKLNYPRAFYGKAGMTVDNRKWVCQEKIREVRQSGANTDNPKIFVDIERKFSSINKGEFLSHDHPVTRNFSSEWVMTENINGENKITEAALIEERTLVFMKPRPVEELEAAKRGEAPEPKYLDPPGMPDFSHALTPDETLLFRFSALTFNAHKIHLDPSYTLNIEGHRNLLVHGPLTLTLMLTLLHDHLRATVPEEELSSINYRNLAPLYCNEPMRICGRKRESGPYLLYDVWIEGPTGRVAVKGTCRTQSKPEYAGWASKKAQAGPTIRKIRTLTREERVEEGDASNEWKSVFKGEKGL
jgi:hydroxyacyl-ACP dehydratase HTD2-like protein with hotdog domain